MAHSYAFTQCAPIGPVEILVEEWLWYVSLPLATKVTVRSQTVLQAVLKVYSGVVTCKGMDIMFQKKNRTVDSNFLQNYMGK